MRKILSFSAFLLILYVQAFSQENFKAGYIVTLKGDTVKGFIDFRNWDRNPVEITFRESENSEKKIHTPLTISSFFVASENYISERVKVETSPYLLNELKPDPELHFETEDAFIYCLVQGKKSLYHYKDARNKDNFYIRTDSGITLLNQKIYLKQVNSEDMTDGRYASGRSLFMDNKYFFKTENKTYLGQLSVYLNDCQAIPKLINTVEYNQTSLLKLFQIYSSKCDRATRTNNARSAVVQFGVVAGLSLNSLQWGKNQTFEFSKTEYGYKPNAVAGILLEVKFRGHMNKWSLYNELLYAPFKVAGEYENYINEQRYTYISTEIGSQYIKMNNMVRLTWPMKKYSVFANAGLSNSYGNVKYNSASTISKYYADETKNISMAMKYTDKYELGFNFGIGGLYENWSFEARWEQGDGMSSLAALNSKTKRLYLLVSYRLSKN